LLIRKINTIRVNWGPVALIEAILESRNSYTLYTGKVCGKAYSRYR
jgi:hypothetical protein